MSVSTAIRRHRAPRWAEPSDDLAVCFDQIERRSTFRTARRATSSWAWSAAVHAAALLLLSLLGPTHPVASDGGLFLISEAEAQWATDALSVADPGGFVVPQIPSDDDPTPAGMTIDPTPVEILLANFRDETLSQAESEEEWLSTHRDFSRWSRRLPGAANRDDQSVRFFGASARGERFVFLLDISGSMNTGERYRRAFEELLRTIDRLDERQQFFVVLFSNDSRAMFDLSPSQSELFAASEENKVRLRGWLSTIVPTGWTDPRSAIDLAHALRPDGIFLLSDGEFKVGPPTQRLGATVLRQLRAQGIKQRVPIHAIAFEDGANARTLRAVAAQTDGSFRYVPPSRAGIPVAAKGKD